MLGNMYMMVSKSRHSSNNRQGAFANVSTQIL